MDEEMTETQLTEIETRVNAATPGPWFTDDEGPYITTERVAFGPVVARVLDTPTRRAIVAVMNARANVPALVAEVRRLRAEAVTPQGETWRSRCLAMQAEYEEVLREMDALRDAAREFLDAVAMVPDRKGPMSVEAINRLVHREMARTGLEAALKGGA